MRLGSVCLGVVIWVALCVAAFADPTDQLDHAQKLLESNLYQHAYELLKTIENDAIGEPSFDRMLAEAAAGIGETSEATVSLERQLHLNPSAVEARMELARIYAGLGNFEQAKFQLERVTTETTNVNLMQQAYVDLKIVEERLSKRRKRPEFTPSMLPQSETVESRSDRDLASLTPGTNLTSDLQGQIAKAQSLLNEGQAQAAYDQLIKLEFEGSGNAAFDYLLGVTALEAGKPDKATLALERVLASDPNHAGARIDMGRALMLLGDSVRAKEEFAAVLALNPSVKVRQVIEGFLAQMSPRRDGKKTSWTGFFGITLGRDSNVNNAPGDDEQFIPGIPGTVVLDANSVETPSNYSLIAGRIQVEQRFSERIRVYAAADLSARRNFQAPQFDSTSGEFRTGSVVTLSNHELEFSLTLGKTFLDSQPGRSDTFLEHPLYRNLLGGTAQWRFNVNQSNQLQTTLQYNRQRYLDEETKVFDSDQTVLGLNWFHAFEAGHESIGFLGTYLGKESDIRGNPSGEKDFFGLRLGGQYGLASNCAVFAIFGLMSADHQRFQVIHQAAREDRRYDVTLGMTYAMWESWSLRPQVNLTRQDSNISLYDFDRKEISVTLRRDWR